jgi:hypothetical protein
MTNLAAAPAPTAAVVYGHVTVELDALPSGVTTNAVDCRCGDLSCYFCDARDFAIWQAVAADEMADWAAKHYGWED